MLMPKLSIIGCGPGNPSYLLPVAREMALEQDLLVGKKIFLDFFPEFKGIKRELSPSLQKEIGFLKQEIHKVKVGLLVSGSPLQFSLARLVLKEVGRKNCVIIPGISVVEVALARLGLDREKLFVSSFHGRRPLLKPEDLLSFEHWVFFLDRDLSWLKEQEFLFSLGKFFYLENLTLPEERVLALKGSENLPQVKGPALLVGSKWL